MSPVHAALVSAATPHRHLCNTKRKGSDSAGYVKILGWYLYVPSCPCPLSREEDGTASRPGALGPRGAVHCATWNSKKSLLQSACNGYRTIRWQPPQRFTKYMGHVAGQLNACILFLCFARLLSFVIVCYRIPVLCVCMVVVLLPGGRAGTVTWQPVLGGWGTIASRGDDKGRGGYASMLVIMLETGKCVSVGCQRNEIISSIAS